MNWFWIALIGPILYAVSNHTDKYLIDKYFKEGESGALILFSSLFSIVFLPVVYFVEPTVFSLDIVTILALVVNGMLNVICLILYFKTLQDDEASLTVPYYQTIPIFGFVLAYALLGETLSFNQIVACGLIILGTIILSLDLADGKINLKKRAAALMLSASFLYAVSGVIFKLIAVEEGFWASLFWDFSGMGFLGITILVASSSYRRQFLHVFKINGAGAISLNFFNELITIIADGTYAYATMMAPIVLVMTINGFQPAFVFLLGIILTVFFPKLGQESMERNCLAQKFLAIGIITIGTYMLGTSGAL